MVLEEKITDARSALTARLHDIPASKQLRFIPIRHHSPACARHLESLIKQDKPDLILIEGPSNADHLLPSLTASAPPIALYSYFVDKNNKWLKETGVDNVSGSARYRCFYPYASFSPEWVAMQAGRRVGAQVRFIDLPYGAILAAARGRSQDMDHHDTSQLSDRNMMESDVVHKLVTKNRCRDFNEWWDRFYENDMDSRRAETYFRDLAALAMLFRDHYTPVDEETRARELFMAHQVRCGMDTAERVFVITGAFHTEALARHLGNPPKAYDDVDLPANEQGIFLVPYSLTRLDSANQYAAGIPQCGYYANVWSSWKKKCKQPHRETIHNMVMEVGNGLQRAGEPISFSDMLETVVHSLRLAELRGILPGRSEMLDAMETTFVKGDLYQHQHILNFIRDQVTPEKVGKLPSGMPVASIVEDFRNTCITFGLPLHASVAKTRHLDIYRSERHLDISRFLHRLCFLGIPYAKLVAGPDFIGGEELKRVREIWEIQWTPEVEALLIESMRYGGQLEDAALNVLMEKLAARHDGPYVVEMLIQALMMGLHPILPHVLDRIAEWLRDESDLVKLVNGLRGLDLAHSAQNTLQTFRIPNFTILLRQAFDRACSLIGWIGHAAEDRLRQLAEGFIVLNEMVSRGETWADKRLFLSSIEDLHARQAPARLQGVTASILACQQVWNQARTGAELSRVCEQAYFDASMLGEYMRGFLPIGRHLLIQNKGLVQAMTRVMVSWDESVFINTLPALRLAFTYLTPRETKGLAVSIAAWLTRTDEPADADHMWSDADQAFMKKLKLGADNLLKAWGVSIYEK